MFIFSFILLFYCTNSKYLKYKDHRNISLYGTTLNITLNTSKTIWLTISLFVAPAISSTSLGLSLRSWLKLSAKNDKVNYRHKIISLNTYTAIYYLQKYFQIGSERFLVYVCLIL